jgi:hypothetical protein
MSKTAREIMSTDATCVGVVSQGDLAAELGHEQVGELVEAISS